jgi:hypothetical protein
MATLVFVHGWSVTNTSTYGDLPATLRQRLPALGTRDIYLSEYESFIDAVTVDDLVRAFDHALRGLQLDEAEFDCITHSTGGPVVRAWLRAQRAQPASHATIELRRLIMLAPANFGSALAQLGKGALGRIKAWWNGVQPGQRILDWLELGSAESLAQNLAHIHDPDPATTGSYFFVLTGDRPDRALYDHVNAYTGEDGSDGVVRIAAANLNARHVVLTQEKGGGVLATQTTRAPRSAFKLIAGAAHSGDRGIMAAAAESTVAAILRCLAVEDMTAYAALCDAFAAENRQRDADKVEREPVGPFPARVHIHDPRSMLIVRMRDDRGEALAATQYVVTAGAAASADHLPRGFMLDRQGNTQTVGVVTLFLNYAVLAGDAPVADPDEAGQVLRAAIEARRPYGAKLVPADLEGLVHHSMGATEPGSDLLDLLSPHETTVIDVVLTRKVHEGVFRFVTRLAPEDFRTPVPGQEIA